MKDIISYDDFAKLDIRIGEIVAVEVVPETDKLLKLTVDFGLKQSASADDSSDQSEIGLGEEREVRTIVSGIREHLDDPQDIVGLKTSFVLNLAPRMLRGIESQGMLFACGGGDVFSFMIPQKDVAPGSPLI